jgi:hypothetical protein
MPFNRIAENRIREAIEAGAFDGLPGAGKPLDLEEYFSAPEDLRMAHSVLKSANCVPLEVELQKQVANLKLAVDAATDEGRRKELRRALTHCETELAIRLERKRNQKR